MSTGLPNRSESSAAMLTKRSPGVCPGSNSTKRSISLWGPKSSLSAEPKTARLAIPLVRQEFSQAVSWKQYVLVHAVGSCRCVSMFASPILSHQK